MQPCERVFTRERRSSSGPVREGRRAAALTLDPEMP